MRGNPMAQLTLADNAMDQAVANVDTEASSDLRLFATTLFGLAAQQGNEAAIESLSRAVELEMTASEIESEEEFLSSTVVQTAQFAMV